MSSGISSAAGLAGSGGGTATAMTSPALTSTAGSRTVRPAIVTCPARISAFRRDRDSPSRAPASTRSSRPPAASGGTVIDWTSVSSMNAEKPLDPEAAAALARVRRLMMIASVTTFVAIGAVFAVIGYRVFHWQGSVPRPAPATEIAGLPAGAKVLSTAVGDGHVVMTLEVGGAIELRTFDLTTLKPLARVRLAPEH